MTPDELAERLEALEVRYAHQDAALEELTRTVLEQERLIKLQARKLSALEQAVGTLRGSSVPTDEIPPHY